MTQPAEHCGHQPDTTIGQPTECVLRPGHSGSHADETGMRWWKRQPEPAQPRHTADEELWHLRLDKEGHDAALQAACRQTEEQRQRADAAEVKRDAARNTLDAVRALAAYFIEHGNKRTGNERAAARRFLDLLDRHQPQEKP